MMLDLQDHEAELLRLLLVKELEETRVEERHAKNIEFKAGLERREKTLKVMLGRLPAS